MTRPFTEEERRLRWQCRRGLKELDVILEPFMEDYYRDAPELQQQQFQCLLQEEDVDLLSWFMGYLEPERADYRDIVAYVKQSLAHQL